MRKAFGVLLLAAFAFGLAGTPSFAFNQPPLNLGLTDILDAPPGPGTYFTEYIQAYQSDKFKDKDGNDIPGNPEVANVLSMNQLVHVYPYKILGGHIGADVLLPVVAISVSGTFGPPIAGTPPAGPVNAVTSNPAVLGDLIVGPFLQWFDTKLLGRPFLQRFELDVVLPTGQYDEKYIINPGSNLWTIEPHYAFTWFLTPQLSTSWRLMYDYSTENDDTKVKPGQVFHLNYSVEYELFKNFRGAVTGYYLKQITDDEDNGQNISNSKEQVFAIGPAVFWAASPNFFLGLKTQWESSAENRPEGNRTTFRMTYKF
ncbi:SphA family protein [Candidatus Deferrimicrobium sp.]|uniref:SphA family protein n=1 Tax=Candidatus Deferrimicrobium sp. TaxID=3060586 RepID=UPI003C555A8B